MWSVDVVPNNGTSCLALEEQYQTHVMVRKKNARGEGCHAKHFFEAKMCPLMSVMQNKVFSDHFFSFKLLFLSISEYTLLI